MYLTLNIKSHIIEYYLKDKFGNKLKTLSDNLGKVGDEIYDELFAEYLLMIDILPQYFFHRDDKMYINNEHKVKHVELSSPRIVPFYSSEKLNTFHITHLLDEYQKRKFELDHMTYLFKKEGEDLTDLSKKCRSRKQLLTACPQLKESWEWYANSTHNERLRLI